MNCLTCKDTGQVVTGIKWKETSLRFKPCPDCNLCNCTIIPVDYCGLCKEKGVRIKSYLDEYYKKLKVENKKNG